MISRHTIRVMLFYRISMDEALSKVDIHEMTDFEKKMGLYYDPLGCSVFDKGLDEDYMYVPEKL